VQAVHEWSVEQALEALRAERIDAEAYAGALLARCAAHSGLNAFIDLTPAAVLEQARRADRARHEGTVSELNGLPIAVKDNIDVAGIATTAGTPGLARNIPAVDAAVVGQLRQRGAIVFGKTNLDELGFGFIGENAHFGTTANPYARDHMAGGSSSGSAAAVAARLVPASLGTDTSGSLRVPAALCGVIGFRPTAGRYPARGVVPIAPTRDAVGLLTRQVADALLLDAVISGEPIRPEPVELRGVRLGVPREYFYENLDPELSLLIESELCRLSRLGVELVEANLPGVSGWAERCRPIIDHELASAFPAHLAQAGISATLAELIRSSKAASVRRLIDAPFLRENGGVTPEAYRRCLLEERGRVQAAYSRYFAEHGVSAIVFLTTPAPACRIEDALAATAGSSTPLLPYGQNTTPASLAGLPAITLPLGLTAKGLPIGIELDAPAASDRRLLSLAAALSAELPALPAPALGD